MKRLATTPAFIQLPALVLAGMLVLGVGLEVGVYGTLLWPGKLPLAVLLVWLWRRQQVWLKASGTPGGSS